MDEKLQGEELLRRKVGVLGVIEPRIRDIVDEIIEEHPQTVSRPRDWLSLAPLPLTPAPPPRQIRPRPSRKEKLSPPTPNLPTAHIAEHGRWAVGTDGVQWILRRRTDKGRWVDVSFVRSTKDILARCMREESVPADAAESLLGACSIRFDGRSEQWEWPEEKNASCTSTPDPRIVPDRGLYRIRYSDGSLSDMVNLTRARDALAYLTP